MTEDGQGQHGIEQYYNDLLAGTPTKVASLVGPGGTSLESSQQVLQPGRPGSTIQLTIDAGLQLQLEKELYATWVADPSSRVSATIIDPWTGEVLAWASVPGYDENDYSTVASTSPGLFADPIASQVYEPGSVMKMLTAAAALNAGVVTLDQTVQDSTELRFGSDVIRNYDDLSMGRLPFEDAVAYSRNVAVAKVAATLDKTVPTAAARLYGMWQQFGIGQPTGIDLANEAAGIVADPATQPWQPVDLADRAFGQGVAVTQVQLAVAYAAMVNGGMKVTPYLVKQIDDTPHAVAPPTSIISPSLAGQLQSLLQHVTEVVPWYKSGTQIPGYVVGGKTGTAQIWDASANAWEPNTFNFSFDGFVGTDKPRAVITIRIQDGVPDNRGGGNLYLAVASYQLFRRLAIDTMSAMGVPPLTGGQPPIASPSPTPSSRPSGGGGGGANGGSGGSGSGGHGHGPSPSPTPRPTPKPTTSPPARPSPDPSPGPSAGG